MQSREEHYIHRDLGTLDGPVLLFGGPYSNAQATSALLAEAEVRGIAPDRMICTGDVVAYCAAPRQTVELIRSAGIVVVAGNCEKQLAAGAPDCGCGFEQGTTCDLLSFGWYQFAQSQMRAEDRAWMQMCPDIISFRLEGRRYAVIHGGVSDISRFIWPSAPVETFTEEWALIEDAIGPVDGVIAGHCGIAFQRSTPRGVWINAGVIGMPPHDGRPQTRFVVLSKGQADFHELAYDTQGAVTDMVAAGLSQGYHASIETGYWPSEDVLPSDLRVASLASG